MMGNEIERMSNEQKNVWWQLGVIIGLIFFFPFYISLYLTKLINNTIVNKKHSFLKKCLIILFIILVYSLPAFLVAFFLKGFTNSIFTWYDFLVPVLVIFKIVINFNELNFGSTISALFLTPLFSVIILTPFFILIRDHVLNSFQKSLEHYQKKLDNDELSKNPRKDMHIMKLLFYWLLSIDKNHDWKTPPNKNKYVMLDDVNGIPRTSLSRHLAIMGTTGSGKTMTLYKFLYDGMKQNKGIVFVDGKGDTKDLFKVKKMAQKANKKFYAFTIDGKDVRLPVINSQEEIVKTTKYNPFSTSKKGILTDMIMACFNFTEEHYKAAARTFFEILIETLIVLKIKISLSTILFNLDIGKLINLLKRRYKIGKYSEKKEINSNKNEEILITNDDQSHAQREYNIALNLINNVDVRGVAGFNSRIGMIYQSTKNTISENGKTLTEIFEEGSIIYFSLNSTDYAEAAPLIGKLIVNDIKASAEQNAILNKKSIIALDEFNVFADNNVVDILNKGRSKGYEVILAFQSIADLEKVSKSFMQQIVENTNNKILHQTNDPASVEYLAASFGTKKAEKKTYVTEYEEATGKESVRVVDQLLVPPNKIKNLATGEAFLKYANEKSIPVSVPYKIKIIIPEEILDL